MVRKSQRPTKPPEFDAPAFARESDARMQPVRATPSEGLAARQPRSETRLSTRPAMAAAMTDEAWARSMTGAPVAVVGSGDLVRLPLDHRAGFLLSRMDGYLDLDTLVEISAMRRPEALRLLRDLYDSGIIEFH